MPRTDRPANLVGEFYELLDELDVRSWDLSDPLTVNRLGTLARFSSLLADYESVRRRARPDPDAPGEQVGGQDRGIWYYRNLAIHIINYAQGAYEGFDGEADFALDAVDLTTVHRAKGLEWPVVFVPSVTASRFPTTRDWPDASLARSTRPLRRRPLRGQRRRRAAPVLCRDHARPRLAVGLPAREGHKHGASRPAATTGSLPTSRSSQSDIALPAIEAGRPRRMTRSRSPTANWPPSSTVAWPSGCAICSASSPGLPRNSVTARPSTT